MMLVIHIMVAVLSMVWASVVLWRPTVLGLRISCGLLVGMTGTGAWLLIDKPAVMAHTCVTGLVYVGLVGALTIGAWRRLRTASISGE